MATKLTIATIVEHRGEFNAVVVSNDKDCNQLLENGVMRFSNNEFLKQSDIVAKWGVRPEQFVDYQMLLGDSTDCVVGLRGCGEVGAKDLLAMYGSASEIADATDLPKKYLNNIKPTKKDPNPPKTSPIEDFRERLESIRKLITLERNVPIDVPTIIESGKPGQGNKDEFYNVCNQYGIGALMTDRFDFLFAK